MKPTHHYMMGILLESNAAWMSVQMNNHFPGNYDGLGMAQLAKRITPAGHGVLPASS